MITLNDFLIEYLNLLVKYRDLLITIIGWIVVFYLGLWAQKRQLKDSANLKVYEEIYNLRKQVDSTGQELSLLLNKFSLPFLSMSFEKTTPEETANKKALDHWNKHVSKLNNQIFEFTSSYLTLWELTDMWIGAIPNLQLAKKELFEKQLKNLTDELHKYCTYIQNQPITEYDWKKWNKEEIEKRTTKISDLFDQVAVGYVDDFVGLAHNRLVSPILGYKKRPRENFVNLQKLEKYYILTEKGLNEIRNNNQ